MKKLKIGDIFIYMLLAVFALIGFLGMKYMVTVEGQRVVVILLDGEEIDRIPLKPNMRSKEIQIDARDGDYNIVHIDYEGVSIVEASCRDSLCIKQGSIERPGQSIVCLPNRVVIKILGEDVSPPVDDVTYIGGQL